MYIPISSNLYWFRNWFKKTWNASRQSIENRKSVQVSGCDCPGFNFRQSSELVQLFQRVDDGLAFLQVGDLGANLAGGHFVIQAWQINGKKVMQLSWWLCVVFQFVFRERKTERHQREGRSGQIFLFNK